MGPLRVLHISMVVLMLFGSAWLVRLAGMSPSPGDASVSWLAGTEVRAGVLQSDNGDNNGGGDNGDNNGGGDDNDNDSGDDNDNFDDFELPPLPTSSRPARPPEPVCTTPGQDAAFTSYDEKVTVRVFANTPRPVRVEINQMIDFLTAPLPPGNLVGLLAYEIRASYCDANPLEQFPAEVNLGIRYSNIEATGLDESRFVIGHLDRATNTWAPVEKRANDPSSNYTSATIIETGFYMVWEAR